MDMESELENPKFRPMSF